MARSRKTLTKKTAPAKLAGYEGLFADVARVIEEARHSAVRTVNAVMTATYWLVGRRIVEAEQAGETRAEYGKEIVDRLSADLTERFGRGFGRSNLFQMRAFFLARRNIVQTASGQSAPPGDGTEKVQTASGQLGDDASLSEVAACFPLPWSHDVRLLAVKNERSQGPSVADSSDWERRWRSRPTCRFFRGDPSGSGLVLHPPHAYPRVH